MKVTEAVVAGLWSRQLFDGDHLATQDGRPLQIVNPGREDGDCGPDFKGADIIAGGGRLLGDIEVEVSPRNWYQHGHHRDARYDNVVLNVVMAAPGEPFVLARDGKRIAVFALDGRLGRPLEELQGRLLPRTLEVPCAAAGQDLSEETLSRRLEALGLLRFEAKSARMAEAIRNSGAIEAFYRGLMRGLGYTRNMEPFERLAAALPVGGRAFAAAAAGRRRVEAVQALLFGSAGLLPSQRHGAAELGVAYAARLENIWKSWGLAATLSERDWRFFRVRPANCPTRRLAAASHLLKDPRGLLESVAGAVAVEPPSATSRLSRLLTVKTRGFWAVNFDFGRTMRPASPWLLGEQRASGLAIDIILPFCRALGTVRDDSCLADSALRLYLSCGTPAGNRTTRLAGMRLGRLAEAARVMGACRQQGLIHLDGQFCAFRRCGECPLLDAA